MSAQIGFRCASPSHQRGEAGPDKLTIHEGQWAYCPFDAHAREHQWEPTGGKLLFDLDDRRLRRAPARPRR